MSHDQTINSIEPSNHATDMSKTIEQQLNEAKDQIADLKLQLAWLERSYE